MSASGGKRRRGGPRPARVLALLLAALAAGLVADAWRKERVFFPRKEMPVFETVPAK